MRVCVCVCVCVFLRPQGACGDGLLYRFGIPELKVGTLDSLLALSDETARHSAYVEGIVGKIRRQRDELVSSEEARQKLVEEDEKVGRV